MLNGTETVLVVDDELALAELTHEILKSHGYEVFIANHAQQALSILEKNNIDLVITDVIMPDIDGYELASLIHQRYPKMPIQIISGFAGDNFINDDALELKKHILYKPYTSKTLLTHVRNLLENIKK